jgi:hypothetical protein
MKFKLKSGWNFPQPKIFPWRHKIVLKKLKNKSEAKELQPCSPTTIHNQQQNSRKVQTTLVYCNFPSASHALPANCLSKRAKVA